MKKKIQSRSGETLVETLFSMLIIVLAVMMLAGSIVTSARINKSGRDMNNSIMYNEFTKVTDKSVKVKIVHGAESKTESISVTGYQTQGSSHYFYYDCGTSAEGESNSE